MKQYWLFCTCCLILFSCNEIREYKLAGQWQIEALEINQTHFAKELLQDAYMEFTTENEYKNFLFGKQENGIYRISNDSLWLHCTNDSVIADKYFLITESDSSQLLLYAHTAKNEMKLHLTKKIF